MVANKCGSGKERIATQQSAIVVGVLLCLQASNNAVILDKRIYETR